jgi:two-component system, NarL family, nitrate/nitrite response regulator NarL
MAEPLPKPIRILIADDHPIVRDGLKRLLLLQEGFTVVGEAADGIEAVRRTEELKPDVLLLDLTMPRMDGLGVLKALAGTPWEPRSVLLTAAIEREETVQALRLGAHGIVLKESVTELLYQCIRAVMNGDFWVGHERISDLLQTLRELERGPRRAPTPASSLTLRERQVIGAIVDGATNKDIGKQFGLSEQTVKNHLSHIFDKLGVSNRLELALYAVHHHLLADRDGSGRGTADDGGKSRAKDRGAS